MSQVAQEPTSFRGRDRTAGAVSMFFIFFTGFWAENFSLEFCAIFWVKFLRNKYHGIVHHHQTHHHHLERRYVFGTFFHASNKKRSPNFAVFFVVGGSRMFLVVSSRFVGHVEGVGCPRFFETSSFLKVFLPPLTPTHLPGGFMLVGIKTNSRSCFDL